MFENKKNYFKNRIKFDKPVIAKNANDFNDSDIDSSFSFDESNKSNEESNHAEEKNKDNESSNKTDESNKNLGKNEEEKNEDEKENNKVNYDNGNENKEEHKEVNEEKEENKNIPEENEKNQEKENNNKIEKELILSIVNKESMTRERLNMAEAIQFRNEPDKIIATDEYGFIKVNEKSISQRSSAAEVGKNNGVTDFSKTSKDLLQVNARIEKWNYMLEHYDEFSTKKRGILKSRARKGIPDSLRGYAWQLFGEKDKFYVPNLYKELESKPIKNEFERTIIKDLDRTFPLCQFFREKYGNGQRKLYKVLTSYCKYNPAVGYVQGMGFITAIFLTYMDEESSFYMLHSLMKKYDLENIYYDDFPGLKKKFYILLSLQKKHIPKIYKVFRRDGILPSMYASNWFITLFTRNVDFSIVLRIFDCFLLEGFKVIYRITLALLKLKENVFCKGKAGCSLPLIQSVPDKVNVDDLFKTAFGFQISRNYIEKCEEEFEKNKDNKDNEFIAQLCW